MTVNLVPFPRGYIGQENLTEEITRMIQRGTFPRFVILEGSKGSGKRTLARELIAKTLGATFIECETGVDAVREVVGKSYKSQDTVVYFIDDADWMSTAAKNTLLKVTEEPPNAAYFVVGVIDRGNILETITSRAVTFPIAPYSPEQLTDYWYDAYGQWADRWDDIKDFVRNVGDLQYFADEFMSASKGVIGFAQTVLENVATVSGVNALKIAGYFNLGDDPTKIDPEFFMHVFKMLCYKKLVAEKDETMAKWILITCRTERMLRDYHMGVLPLLDTWMFDLRSVTR